MTRQDALNWLYSNNGAIKDFDGIYGAQCVDYFNFYYKFLTGRSPYADGYTENGAKDIWNVPTDRFTKIANNPHDPNQLPDTGDILIYNSTWGGGYGHVEMVLSADYNGVNVSAQNSKGQYVDQEFRPWKRVVGGLIGWLSFNGFQEEAPSAPVQEPTPTPDPVPAPPSEPPVETPAPTPDPTPSPVEEPTPVIETKPTPEVPKTPPKVIVPEPSQHFSIWELIVAILQKIFKRK